MGRRGAMRHSTTRTIDADLRAAEHRNSLLAPTSKAERNALRRRVRSGAIVEPLPGLFARKEPWNALTPQAKLLSKLRGLQQIHPDWVFCRQTAAVALGLPVATWHLDVIHRMVAYRPRQCGDSPIRLHRDEAESITTMDIRVTSPRQTVLDCARVLPFCDALAIADAAARFYGLTQNQLAAYAESHAAGKKGVAQARSIAALMDGASESWGESQARGLMHQLGFSLPQLQAEIELPAEFGGTRRVDFLWELNDQRVVLGEFDGKGKYTTSSEAPFEALYRERQRESRLSLLGAPIMRFGYDDLKDSARFGRLLEAYGIPRDH